MARHSRLKSCRLQRTDLNLKTAQPQTRTTVHAHEVRERRVTGGAMDPGHCPPDAKPGWLPQPIEVIDFQCPACNASLGLVVLAKFLDSSWLLIC